jgi:hypothetical protein
MKLATAHNSETREIYLGKRLLGTDVPLVLLVRRVFDLSGYIDVDAGQV